MTPYEDRPGLQAERTGLAWSRTGLSASAAALALARLASVRDAPLLAVVGLVAAAGALAAFVEGSLRHERRRRWLDEPTLERGVPLIAMTLLAVVVGLALTGLALLVVAP